MNREMPSEFCKHTQFLINQCDPQTHFVMASFPSLPRPMSRNEVGTAPFSSDLDVTAFLTSQSQQDESHFVDLAAIAQKSVVLSAHLYAAQNNQGKINNRVGLPAGPSKKNDATERVQKKRRRNHRSRRGCWTCRLRHKACPEDGAPCSACSRLNLRCDTGHNRPTYMQDREHATDRLREIRVVTDKLRGRYIRQTRRKKHAIV